MTDCQNNLMSDRLLKESNVIAALRGLLESPSMQELGTGISFLPEVAAAVHNVPETDVVPLDYHERCMELVTQRNIAQMRKHGRWIRSKGKSGLWYCSECGSIIIYKQRKTYNIPQIPVEEKNKFCRCCGAKMDGGTEL